jgi:hypothetical protein
MTREEELQAALIRLEYAIDVLTESVEQIGLLRITLRRLLAQEIVTKPAFNYQTGLPPE